MERKVLVNKIVKYLKDNPKAILDDLDGLAEDGLDVNKDKIKSEVLNLAKLFSIFWLGGRAKEKGITVKNVDPKELKMGIDVEKEHSPNKAIATKVALDHLAEDSAYYTKLAKAKL
jgi:hypothetical protein